MRNKSRTILITAILICFGLAGITSGEEPTVEDSEVVDKCSSFSISTRTLAEAAIRKEYTETIALAGGESPYKFELVSGSLPDGIKLDEKTGALAGIPTSAGRSDFSIAASDSLGCKTSAVYHLEVISYKIIDIVPAEGTAEGGDEIVVIGENFRTGLIVLVDDVKPDVIEVLSDKAIKIKIPKYNKNMELPHEAEVRVIQDNVSTSAAKKFRYVSGYLPLRFRSGVLVVNRGRVVGLSFNLLIVFSPGAYFSPTEIRTDKDGKSISRSRRWIGNRLGLSLGLQLGERGETTQNLLAALSYKVTREADIIGGIRFGSHDPTTPFRLGESVFIGMTFDPVIVLKLEAGK